MQRLHFASGSAVLTGDAVAAAVLDYAWALLDHRRADLVELPVLREDGTTGRAALLIGPHTPISAEQVPSSSADPVDAALVHDLRRRAAALRDPIVVPYLDDGPPAEPGAPNLRAV